jgi:shikimate dehydrogenase
VFPWLPGASLGREYFSVSVFLFSFQLSALSPLSAPGLGDCVDPRAANIVEFPNRMNEIGYEPRIPGPAPARIPDAHTVPFAVLGHPVRHSLSPLLHNTAFAALKWNAVYLALDVVPERIPDVLPALEAAGFGGVNLTVPLKEAAYRVLSSRDASAEQVRSVNTVAFTPRGMVGYSTDGEGFLRATRDAFGESPKDRSVFILGAGGAGRAVAVTAAAAGARAVTLADTEPGRAKAVAGAIHAGGWPCEVGVVPASRAAEAARSSDWIVQATPLGLHPEDPLPLPAEAFRPGQNVFDLVYGRAETALVRAAREAGARAANGLDMLLYQGVRSFEIWTGRTPPIGRLRETLRNAMETT